ncbi:GDP-mannose 4,6-dehydratase, partial [bacterium]|nr:GDP-mannose 4,6-dehydratase [bacterium]
HESPRRGENFVSRKITLVVNRIKLGMEDKIVLGNLDSKRDWGYAPEYVEAMWLILQNNEPDDFVIATGEAHTVREFVERAFYETNISIKWEGEGVKEKGICKKTGKTLVEVSPRYFRPTEADILVGDYSKAKKELGWEPKVKFDELVKIMVKADYEFLKKRK